MSRITDYIPEDDDGADRIESNQDPKYNGGENSHLPKFTLIAFRDIKLDTDRRDYLVKGLLPSNGLIIIWGPPKCGKSFWTTDLGLHISLGWKYRGRRVQQAIIVYIALEGGVGFRRRIEAYKRHHDITEAPFYLITDRINLMRDHQALIAAIKEQTPDVPGAVVIDTLNRSLAGSESNDEDMAAYIKAADAVREAFGCAVIIVHHCGIDGTRPRGHTSLTGAADAQIAVSRNGTTNNVLATVEWMKDGAEGDKITSRLEVVEVGEDPDGDPITSCVVIPVEAAPSPEPTGPRLSKNQRTMLDLLHSAGAAGLSLADWYDRARAVGIGVKRKADLYDIRSSLASKRLVHDYGDRWYVAH
jgi:hypothetical protein